MASNDSQDVKRRIKSVTSMEHITNAMKLVSSAKLRKARANFERTNQNFIFIKNTIDEIVTNSQDVPEKYLAGTREIKKACYILITSNKGLCGSFNGNLLKAADAAISMETATPVMIAIGSKGRDHFRKENVEIWKEYLAPPEDIDFLGIREACRPIISAFESGEYDRVVLISTAFVSPLQQEVRVEQLLPFVARHDPDVIRHEKEVEYEPSEEEVFNYLVPKHLEISLYGAIIESATCEHAARRMAMENATDAARDMLDDLTLTYNRARQASITNEIIEIVSGSEAQGQ